MNSQALIHQRRTAALLATSGSQGSHASIGGGVIAFDAGSHVGCQCVGCAVHHPEGASCMIMEAFGSEEQALTDL